MRKDRVKGGKKRAAKKPFGSATAGKRSPEIAAASSVATEAGPPKGDGRASSGPQASLPQASLSPVPLPPLRADRRPAFPVVGIGASAGGLEALEEFLRNVPPASGMAFVVVQHLDASGHHTLVDILQRSTKMKVTEIHDGQRVLPNVVYVIPAGQNLSILHGVLHLLPKAAPLGLSLPIDFFFRSLAEDRQEQAMAVILSGMGSDGTLGLRAIKERAGATFVQSLTSAKFDGMPRSAIDAGLADVIAAARDIPGKILAYRAHAPLMARSQEAAEEAVEDKAQNALEKVFVLLRAQTGNDFSLYKRSTIYRRIERRMGLHQIDNLPHYVRYLRENRREIDLLFKELLIGVTNFFREAASWDYLRAEVLPALLASRSAGGVIRAWVPGCSTGEEAYSLAMVFKEAMEPYKPVKSLALQIFATDLDRDAIEKARQALYPDNIVADVSPERLRRFFVQEDRGYRVGKEIREMVVFAPQNVIMDPPFTKLDILSCRNLLIYLSADLQKKLIPLFHYSLNPGGILFLGSAETVGSFTNLFAPLDGKTRLYRRLDQSMASVPVEFPSPSVHISQAAPAEVEPDAAVPKTMPPNLQMLADRVIVQRFAPVGILCNDKGDILYISGRAGKYLEPSVGKANMNVFAMAREGLRYELTRAFAGALREDRTVIVQRVKVGTNGGTQIVDVTVQKLVDPRELRGCVMVVLADVPAEVASTAPRRSLRTSQAPRIAELEQELQRTREEVQTTREEMQTSQEELKSTNEELQSTNEELQSTNEELTTSKEEMQSLNEELQTVNHELQSKVDELSRSNNDMKNLLNSTDIATLFLDGELRVRRFTTPTARIIKLIPGDAGRPITDIASDLSYDDLADDAREVLQTLVFKEKQVSTRDGRWFVVRILPYRTLENVIDGVVITFSDASASRTLEAALREQTGQLRQMTDSLPILVWGGPVDGSCDTLSRQWAEYTGVPDASQRGFEWLEQVHPDDRERVRAEWKGIGGGRPIDLEMRIRSAGGVYRWFRARAAPIRDTQGNVTRWYGSNIDIEDAKRAQAENQRGADRLQGILDHLPEAVVLLDANLSVDFFNRTAEKVLSRTGKEVLQRNFFDAFPEFRGTALDANLSSAFEQEQVFSFGFDLEYGSERGPYEVRIAPQRHRSGAAVFFLRARGDASRANGRDPAEVDR